MNRVPTLVKVISIFILLLLSSMSGCSEDSKNDVFSSLTYQSLTTQIFGGVFQNNQINQNNSTLSVDVMPTSLNTHIDVYTEGCHPVNVTFNLKRNLTRYRLKLRAYREITEGSVLYRSVTAEYIRANGRIFIPITQPIDLPLELDENNSEQYQKSWGLQFNRGNYRFQINHQPKDLDDHQSIQVCSVPKQTTDQTILIRQQLTFQFTSIFKTGLKKVSFFHISGPKKLNNLLVASMGSSLSGTTTAILLRFNFSLK